MNNIEVISVVLGIISIILALRYKKLGDEFNNDIEKIVQIIDNKLDPLAIRIRNIDDQISGSSHLLDLRKDVLYLYKNRNYRINNSSEVIDKLNKELPSVLKQTFIDSIMVNLCLDDDSTTEIGIVTLRHKYNEDDLEKIKKLNDIFNKYGISFKLKIK